MGDACVAFFCWVVCVWHGNTRVGSLLSTTALQSSRGGGQCVGRRGITASHVDLGISTRILPDPVFPQVLGGAFGPHAGAHPLGAVVRIQYSS